MTSSIPCTVGALRKFLADLPEDAEVIVELSDEDDNLHQAILRTASFSSRCSEGAPSVFLGGDVCEDIEEQQSGDRE